MKPKITMLNGMAGADFAEALDQFAAWGLEVVDLKNGIYGKSVAELTPEEAAAAEQALRQRGLSAYCFSTELFHDELEKGEEHFREAHLGQLDRVLAAAQIMRPVMIRLLAAKTSRRASIADSTAYIRTEAPWLFQVYREAIDRIHRAGFQATIENEAHDCIWSAPEEVISFYRELDCAGKVHFTYDVQNMWQMGTFPTLQAYEALKPLIGFLHLKGGQVGGTGRELVWRSALEEASWPVAAITRQAIEDGVSPVICLNPSHGRAREDPAQGNVTERDLRYLQALIGG